MTHSLLFSLVASIPATISSLVAFYMACQAFYQSKANYRHIIENAEQLAALTKQTTVYYMAVMEKLDSLATVPPLTRTNVGTLHR